MSMLAPQAASHRCSVLVIDDDADLRELLRVALVAEGCAVETVVNGGEALHYLRSHAETCIILLDLMLPVLDGTQFRAAQLRDRALAWIPVVVMSASAEGPARARELNARGFLQKPLNLDEVRRVVRNIGCRQSSPRYSPTRPASAA